MIYFFFFFSSRRRHTRSLRDWSSDVCSSDLAKVSRRAARIGFDWPDARAVIPKLAEEIAEIEAEMDAGCDKARLEDEVGDLLFAGANLARKLDIEPEAALR